MHASRLKLFVVKNIHMDMHTTQTSTSIYSHTILLAFLEAKELITLS